MDIRRRKTHTDAGITRRQSRRRIGDFSRTQALGQAEIKEGSTIAGRKGQPRQPFMLNTSDIDDKDSAAEKVSFWQKLKPGYIRRNFTWRGFFKKMGVAAGALCLLVLGYLGYRLYFVLQDIVDRDSGGALALGNPDPSQLNGEGDGRVNILLIGEGGEKHDNGSRLADTIIILSIDPFNYEAALLSIPRDLRVDVPNKWSMKINAAYAIGENDGFSEQGYPDNGPGLLQKTVEQTFDVPIHYYVRVDFQGLKQAIDAVGGVDINIPETVCDYHISWEFGLSCIEAGQQTLNSNQALFYSRTRNSARGDFDRGERQRQVIMALQSEIFSVETFSNPLKIAELMSAAGNHVRTNLSDIGHLRRLYEIGDQIDQNKILSADITEYITPAGDGTSDYVPRTGDFLEIQKYVRAIFVDGFIKKESATIDILNGSQVAGAADAKAEELRSYGYVLGKIGNAPTKNFPETVLYDMSGDAPFTKRYLEKRLGVTARSGSELPDGIKTTAKFVIIIGGNAEG